MNKPINTLAKPKPNLVTKKPEKHLENEKHLKQKNGKGKIYKNNKIKTVKYLDHLFSKEFQY